MRELEADMVDETDGTGDCETTLMVTVVKMYADDDELYCGGELTELEASADDEAAGWERTDW
jgi:hypothetical protein